MILELSNIDSSFKELDARGRGMVAGGGGQDVREFPSIRLEGPGSPSLLVLFRRLYRLWYSRVPRLRKLKEAISMRVDEDVLERRYA